MCRKRTSFNGVIEEGQSLHEQSDESDHDKVEKESDNIDQKKKKKRIQRASIARFPVL
jgi:hypothetical protein